jgi:hypothetical protein
MKTETRNGTGTRTHAVVYCRSLAPSVADETRRYLKRLAALEERGAIRGYDVELWGDAISLEPDHPVERRLCETVDRFEEWAERHGYTLSPAFERCDVRSLVSAEPREVIRLPVVSLAIYDGTSLVAVYPHRADSTRTVADGLEALERHSASEVVAGGA